MLTTKQDALEALERERDYLLARGMNGAEHILVHHAINVIENCSTCKHPLNLHEGPCVDCNGGSEWEQKDVAPVIHGHWIDDYGDSWKCSVCGAETYVDEDWRGKDDKAYKMNYCHYCGAKMC